MTASIKFHIGNHGVVHTTAILTISPYLTDRWHDTRHVTFDVISIILGHSQSRHIAILF